MSQYAAGLNPQHTYDTPEQQALELTPEETRILSQCSKEGIFQRAIPMSIVCGLGGYLGAKAGPLMSTKFGWKPAVIGLSLVGYYMGRISYSKVCIHRALEVPDGNLRKMFPHLVQNPRESLDSPDNYFGSVDNSKTPQQEAQAVWDAQTRSTDIDVASTSSFDTIPSEYYTKVEETSEQAQMNRNYTSYDQLRRQNRQEYNNMLYPQQNNSPQSRYSGLPQDRPVITRPAPQETKPGGTFGGHRTKYGDEME